MGVPGVLSGAVPVVWVVVLVVVLVVVVVVGGVHRDCSFLPIGEMLGPADRW